MLYAAALGGGVRADCRPLQNHQSCGATLRRYREQDELLEVLARGQNQRGAGVPRPQPIACHCHRRRLLS